MQTNPSVRAVWVALFLIVAATALPVAQVRSGQGGAPDDPVMVEFRARTVDGNPVTDLTVSDVVIKVAGRERAIGRIQLFQFGEASPTPRIAPPFATNVRPASGIHDTILVIDDQAIVPGDDRRLGPAVDQYLAGLGPSARVGIVTVMDRGLNVDLTSDRDTIRRAVKAMIGRAPSAEPAAESACRTRRVLDALSTLATRFPPGGAPASVLLFTTGLTAPTSSVQMSRMGNINSGPPTAVCEVESRNYQAFQKLLLESSANLHVVEAPLAPSQPMRAGLEMLAGVSGNTLTQVVSGGEGAMSGLANEMRGWYRATFVPEPGERTDDVQRVEVTSKRAGVKIEARSQVLIPRPVSTTQPREPKDMLREARVYHDLELRVGAYFSQDPGSDKVNVLVLFEPIDDGVKVAAASVALYDPAGTLKVQGTADAVTLGRSPGMLAVATAPGKYRLSVAAVDSRGRAGTVDEPVDVGLVSASPLKLGTLVPGVQEGAFSGRLLFSGTETAMAYVPVYGAAATTPLEAVLEISDSTGTKLGVAPTQILSAPDGSRVIIGGLRLASLAAGDYQMKVLVAVDGQVVGQTSHTFRRK